MSFFGLLVLDASKNRLTINVFTALVNDGVADLTDQDHQASRGVIVGGVGPDHKNHVHNGDKEVRDLSEILSEISELVEETNKGLKILVVLIGLSAGGLNLLLELGEGTSVSRFVLLEELEHLLNALRVQLLTNGVQIV